MKVMLTENQYSKVIDLIEAESQTNECVLQDIDILNGFLDGIVEFDETTLGPELSIEEMTQEIQDPKMKIIFKQLVQRLDSLNSEELREELKKVLSMKNLKEQGTPYLEQNVNIAGISVPKVMVHGALGMIVLAIISKLFKFLTTMPSIIRTSNRRANQRLSSRAVGCQGGAARARLVRRRRRRENWRNFLKKIGLR